MNGPRDDARPLVTALIEAYDALARTACEIDRLRSTATVPPSFWKRLLHRTDATAARLAAAVTGLQMSERRIERLMAEVGVEPIQSLGHSFDPETMEAIDVVTAAGQPPGTVVEELRRGYRWGGRVFRFVQVRVAK
jgi:molecular chaperone GrpE